jgi:hypothetical protein
VIFIAETDPLLQIAMNSTRERLRLPKLVLEKNDDVLASSVTTAHGISPHLSVQSCCAWVADSAGLCRILPTYLVEVL